MGRIAMTLKKSLTPARTELKEIWLIISSMPVIMLIMMGIVLLTPTAIADQPDTPILTVSSVTEFVELTWSSSTNMNGGHSTDVYRCQGNACVPNDQVGNNVNSPYLDATTLVSTDYCYRVEESHAQNQALSNVECVTTLAQNILPNITLFGDNPLDINVGDGYSEQGFSAIDFEDGVITGSVIVDSSEFVDAEGQYNIYYDVEDSRGGTDQEIRLVRVCPVGESPHPQNGNCQAFQDAPEVTIFTEQDGANSILVTWLLPTQYTNDNFHYNYDVERSDDNGQTWSLIGEQSRNIDAKVLDHTNNYREIYHYLDDDINAGSIYIYKVLSKTGQGQGQGNIKYSTETLPIFIPSDLTGYMLKGDGFGIETTTSGTIQPPLMLGWFAWLFPQAFAVDNPIFMSMLSPTNEVFEIQIEPIPTPSYGDEQCQQILDIAFKRNSDGGQELQYIVTILENDIPKHQFTDKVQITAKRVFNNQYYIPFDQQTIIDFTNIKVQVDVNSGVGDPRSFELYFVDFYVPEDNGAC
jgi:hypothetical protein